MAMKLYSELGNYRPSHTESSSSIVMVQEGLEIKHIPGSLEIMPKTTHDAVQFSPNFVVFNEASEGVACHQRITIKNTGAKPAFIRIFQPTSIAFQVKSMKKGVMLNPGLSISTTVTYNFKRPSFLRAVIPVEINGKIIDYQVACRLLIEGISIEPHSIDFGFVDMGYSSGVEIITLKNEGGKSTRFSIDLGTNDLEITVKPMRGIVRPHRLLRLTIELIGMHEGVYFSEFWIKSTPNIRVPFKVNVIVPRLVIYHPNATGDFTLLDFSTAVANTQKYDSFVLRNISSQVASYVVLGEIKNEVKFIRDIDRTKYPVYSAFDIRPIQGRIGPFEGIIFDVGFRPTTSLMKRRRVLSDKSIKWENDFMAFLRIIRVHVTETQNFTTHLPYTLAKMKSRISVLRQHLGLHMDLHNQLPDLHGIQFHKRDDVPIMDSSSSSSSSSKSSMESQVSDVVRLCLHGDFAEGRLKFEPDILHFGEVNVGETSQRVLRISNPLKFAPLHCRYVQTTSVRCFPQSMVLKPEGATEVLLKLTGRESVCTTFKVYFDVEADSCESTTSRRKTKVKVGSYAVQCTATVKLLVTTVKRSCKQIVQSVFGTDYKDIPVVRKKTPQISASLSLTKPKKEVAIRSIDDKIEQKILRMPTMGCPSLSEILDCDIAIGKKSRNLRTSTEVLIPLTPLQICNIRMYPTLFSFGMVVPRSRNYRQLIMENSNEFPVMIRLTNQSSKCVHFPQGNLMILPAGALVTRLVEFRAHHIGKFNGYIDYIINDNHSFELAIIANIVEKQLSLDTREVVFSENWLKGEVYQPMDFAVRIRNKLGAKTSFRWEVPGTCCFFVEPMSGVVRGNSSLYTYICYNPDVSRVNCTEMVMKSENNSYITVRLYMPTQIPEVSFLQSTIDVGEISLNLPTKTTAFLRNFDYFEVEFVIDASSLVHGCTVKPLNGVMPPRGIAALEICLTFSLCCHFNMFIRVTVQKATPLQLKVMGTVSFPVLRLLPRTILLRGVSAFTFQHFMIIATNAGTTKLKLNFLLDEHPEFRISRSTRRRDPDIGHESIFIAPGTSQEFHLYFQPTDLASHVFYLPLVINDILGPALTEDPKTLRPLEYLKQYREIYVELPNLTILDIPPKFATIDIDCTVARYVIFFNKLMFRFNVLTNDVSDKFSIENRDPTNEKSILVDISNFSAADCPFFIRWTHGVEPTITADCIRCTLLRGQSCVFGLEFRPKSPGNFHLEAPIYVRDEVDGELFNKLCILGEYHAPTIHSEHSEIYFEPTPLNTSVERTFRLSTKYFEKDTEIQLRILTPDRYSGTYNDDVLSVHFVDKNIAAADKHSELEVKAVFLSKLRVSFRTIVEFFVADGIPVCPVQIHATADNSLLTIYAFVRNRMSTYECPLDGDKRLSRSSRMSGSFSDEEDDDMCVSKNRQFSAPKISVLSYFGRKSRASFEKFVEFKFNLAAGDGDYSQDTDPSSSHTEDDRKKSGSVKIESRHTSETSTSSFEGIQEQVQYPFFPISDKTEEFEIYMNQAAEAAEEWLYTGPFKFNYYPEIPDGITTALEDFFLKRQSHFKCAFRKGPELGRSFVDALESLLGPKIYDHITLPKFLPQKDVEKAHSIYTLYESILTFLMKNGAHLSHVAAQFLLKYDEYIVFTNSTRRRNSARRMHVVSALKKLSPVKFISRSKQCWLDVILQTYKCFVLPDINDIVPNTEYASPNIQTGRRSTVHRASITASALSLRKFHNNYDAAIQNIRDHTEPSNTYSFNEMFLLGWLTYYYNEQRLLDWMSDHRLVLSPAETKDAAQARKIQNFDIDLADSLVLSAVTAAYCPFITEESFHNLYISPRSYEERLHNAVCVTLAWRKIRLGFLITPMEIVYPNCVKMLMLVAYLFKILPTYIPRAKVKFSCPLTETVIKQISFTNPTNHSVGFLIAFFGNSHEFFRTVTPQPIVRLNGHETVIVNVEYCARKIKKTKAYLLFCGSTIGPYFGRNQTFILEGQADKLAISSEYTICSGLYQTVNKTLTITVPYQNAAEYEIWMSEQQPNQPRTLKQTRWSELCLRKIPRRLFLNQKTIVMNENNTGASLCVTVACITPFDRSFWIIFQSMLGDFIIQINSRWQASLTDNIVVEWDEQVEKCVCTEGDYTEICPLSLSVPIPSRNKQLWSCVAHMFQKTLEPKERLFWSRYLDTHIGLRLIRWLMGDSADAAAREFTHIFDLTVKYNVTMAESPNILSIPKTFTINVVSPPTKNIPMKIHISPLTEKLCEIQLKLTSVDGNERRTYMISFLHL